MMEPKFKTNSQVTIFCPFVEIRVSEDETKMDRYEMARPASTANGGTEAMSMGLLRTDGTLYVCHRDGRAALEVGDSRSRSRPVKNMF
jgi:hypothetical protein